MKKVRGERTPIHNWQVSQRYDNGTVKSYYCTSCGKTRFHADGAGVICTGTAVRAERVPPRKHPSP